VVDDAMRTSHPDIAAVGECAERRGLIFGLVAPLWKHGEACAAWLAGEPAAPYAPPSVFTSLKITGVDLFSAGALAALDEADDEITLNDPHDGAYRKLVLRGQQLVGAVLYGDVADGPWFVSLMQDGQDVEPLRDRLIFGRAYARQSEIAPSEKVGTPGRNPEPLAEEAA